VRASPQNVVVCSLSVVVDKLGGLEKALLGAFGGGWALHVVVGLCFGGRMFSAGALVGNRHLVVVRSTLAVDADAKVDSDVLVLLVLTTGAKTWNR